MTAFFEWFSKPFYMLSPFGVALLFVGFLLAIMCLYWLYQQVQLWRIVAHWGHEGTIGRTKIRKSKIWQLFALGHFHRAAKANVVEFAAMKAHILKHRVAWETTAVDKLGKPSWLRTTIGKFWTSVRQGIEQERAKQAAKKVTAATATAPTPTVAPATTPKTPARRVSPATTPKTPARRVAPATTPKEAKK